MQISDFDYVIVKCGYIDRLMDDSLTWNINSFDEIEIPEEPKKRNRTEREQELMRVGCVFVCYSKTSTKFYDKISKDICSAFKDSWALSDSMCFKVSCLPEAMRVCSMLMEAHHCGCFSFDSLYQMEMRKTKTGVKVLAMEFDTENG